MPSPRPTVWHRDETTSRRTGDAVCTPQAQIEADFTKDTDTGSLAVATEGAKAASGRNASDGLEPQIAQHARIFKVAIHRGGIEPGEVL